MPTWDHRFLWRISCLSLKCTMRVLPLGRVYCRRPPYGVLMIFWLGSWGLCLNMLGSSSLKRLSQKEWHTVRRTQDWTSCWVIQHENVSNLSHGEFKDVCQLTCTLPSALPPEFLHIRSHAAHSCFWCLWKHHQRRYGTQNTHLYSGSTLACTCPI